MLHQVGVSFDLARGNLVVAERSVVRPFRPKEQRHLAYLADGSSAIPSAQLCRSLRENSCHNQTI